MAEQILDDVKSLAKKPSHLSVLLDSKSVHNEIAANRLLKDAIRFACWSAIAGIPNLSIYDRSGIFPPF